MLKRLFGAALQRVVLPIGGAIGRAGVTPNMITVLGLFRDDRGGGGDR